MFDKDGRLVETPFVPSEGNARLTEEQAVAILFRNDKVADWLDRYPPKPATDAEYQPAADEWVVKAWSGKAGQIVLGKVDDRTGEVKEAWTGPQVAWSMARGGAGAFGGKTINGVWLWLTFCALFFVGLADLRRPLSLRNLDLLALLSFSISLRFFNEGEVFWSAPLAYPPLLYLLGRCLWVAARPAAAHSRTRLAGVAARCCLRLPRRLPRRAQCRGPAQRHRRRLRGCRRRAADRERGDAYGHMPVQESQKPCGTADAEGEIRERIQTNGRCEASNPRGDTYGPVSYLAYLPGYAVFGWTGKWDELWAAHATSLLFDALCILGLALVGRRFGGPRLAATLAFAWAAYPFTLYASNSNTNDAIMPAFLIWGFWLAPRLGTRRRGRAAGLDEVRRLLLAPLWLSYPNGLRRARAPVRARLRGRHGRRLPDPAARAGAAARCACLRRAHIRLPARPRLALLDLGLGPVPRAGIPDLHVVQQVLQVLVVAGAVLAAFVPRRKSILQLAALTAALLIGFELVLTHWFYLYIPWFFPFVAFGTALPT